MLNRRVAIGIILGAPYLTALPQSPADFAAGRVVAHMPTRPFLQHYLREAKIPPCLTDFRGKGLLVVTVQTSISGNIASIDLDNSSTPALVKTPMAKFLIASVKQWKFSPMIEKGGPVAGASRLFFYIECTQAVRKITVPDLPEAFQ